jgi:hypothetical protein
MGAGSEPVAAARSVINPFSIAIAPSIHISDSFSLRVAMRFGSAAENRNHFRIARHLIVSFRMKKGIPR